MNAFHTVPKSEFERAVAALDTAIPALAPHQIVVRLSQIAAMVGDGHTGVIQPLWFGVYPVGLYWVEGALRVTAAPAEYQQAIGAKVVGIGDLAIEEVTRRVNTMFPSAAAENEWYVLSTSPSFINRPEVLHGLGIIPALGPAAFQLENDAGTRFTVTFKPMASPPVVNGAFTFTGFISAASRQPLFRQRPGERFWFTLLDSQTVYLNFRGYADLGSNARRLFAFIDSVGARRLVVDLRQNGGGDFLEGRRHLIEPIKRRAELNRMGHLYVLVGRRTYSAAMANATHFRRETAATLVGEPIGERPNSYSENDPMTLPNSRIVVSYSTRYYKFVDEDVPAVLPDVRIDPTWEDFRAGRDAVLEWVMARIRR
jgi:hypothetical protein